MQARGLIGWWPVHAKGVLPDCSGRGQHATSITATSLNASPISGLGLNLNGSSDSVDLSTSTLYEFGTGDLTLAAWVATTHTGDAVVLGRYDGGADLYYIGTSVGAPAFSFAGTFIAAGTFNDGQPHLLLGTRLAGTMYLYVDGVLVGSPAAAADSASPGGVLALGKFGSAGGFLLPGQIYEARIYNRGLTAAEAWELWAPATRWELYQVPRRRSRRGAAAAAGVPTTYALKPGTAAPGTVWRLQPT
jgi:hypothetical protein